MELQEEELGFIQSVVDVAQLVDIDMLVIEPERVRGIDEHKTVVIFEDDNIPSFEFGSIGMSRTDVLVSRLDIVKPLDNFRVEAEIDDERQFVRSLVMKAKGTKIDYRCVNPAHIQAPRIINDEMITDIPLTGEAVLMLQKGTAAMGNADYVKIISDKRGITFELEDITADVFDYTFHEAADHHFSHKYPVKTLLALFKRKPGGEFTIGQKGMLRFVVDGISVYVLPRV